MKRAIGLLLAVVCVGALGCHKIEPRRASVDKADGCQRLRPYQPPKSDLVRFYRYRAHVGVGEPLPSSISVKGDSAKQTYVARSHRTKLVPSGFSIRSVLMVLQFVCLGLGLLLAFVALAASREASHPASRKRNLLVAAAFLLATPVFGYFGGSRVAIDNSSESEVIVSLNGSGYRLPPWSYANLRVAGFTLKIEAKSADQLVEKLKLHPDAGIGDTLLRLFWGNGQFVYTVCGRNEYSMGTAVYRKR